MENNSLVFISYTDAVCARSILGDLPFFLEVGLHPL